MSVIKGKRNQSSIEFLHTARTLQIHTIRKCAGMPKRYTFYLGQPIALCAGRIHQYAKIANSIYPTNAHEYQMRRDYLLKAYAETNNLVAQIETAAELIQLDERQLKYWMEIISNELRLLKGALRSDKERFGKLC